MKLATNIQRVRWHSWPPYEKTNQQHITQKVKIYSEIQIQNQIYNSSTNTIYNAYDYSS